MLKKIFIIYWNFWLLLCLAEIIIFYATDGKIEFIPLMLNLIFNID